MVNSRIDMATASFVVTMVRHKVDAIAKINATNLRLLQFGLLPFSKYSDLNISTLSSFSYVY